MPLANYSVLLYSASCKNEIILPWTGLSRFIHVYLDIMIRVTTTARGGILKGAYRGLISPKLIISLIEGGLLITPSG